MITNTLQLFQVHEHTFSLVEHVILFIPDDVLQHFQS